MKQISILIVTFYIIYVFLALPVYASSYILPYPSSMPGGISYKFHTVWEKLMSYWYFGSYGQFDYNLKESDKYLVEAKTLFEYQQYLLGYNALEKSNDYFLKTLPYLQQATGEGKDISGKRLLLHEASLKHIETLQKMRDTTPEEFFWTPEKNPSSRLYIHMLIQGSVKERKKYI